MDQRLEYFSGWPAAYDVLPHVVDMIFEGSNETGIHLNSQHFLRIVYLIPDDYRTIFYTIFNEFMRHFLFKIVERMHERMTTNKDVSFVDEFARDFGTSPRNYLKGMLGIPPYHLNVPAAVHRRVTDIILFQRMNVPYFQSTDK